MPELPEVEIASRQLRGWLSGRRVVAARAAKSREIRGQAPARFAALAGHMLYYAIQFLDNTNALLQETGPFVIAVPATPRRPPPATPAR